MGRRQHDGARAGRERAPAVEPLGGEGADEHAAERVRHEVNAVGLGQQRVDLRRDGLLDERPDGVLPRRVVDDVGLEPGAAERPGHGEHGQAGPAQAVEQEDGVGHAR